MTHLLFRRTPWIFILWAISTGAVAQSFAAPNSNRRAGELDVTGPVVALSPFEVKVESMEFSHWRKVTSPHFILYTDTSAKEATKLVRQMEMMRQAVAFYLKRRNANMSPMIVVLPEERSDWRKFRNMSGVEWEVATSMVGEVRKVLLAEYSWKEGLQPVWSMLAVRTARAANVEGPLWFDLGLSSFFGTVVFKGDTLTLGKQGHEAYSIRNYGWLDWPRFFNVTTKSPEYRKDTNDTYAYMAQCGVFAHHILTHADKTMVPRLLQWAAFLDAGNEPAEAAFKEIFQHDFKGWQQLVKRMLDGGEYVTGTIKFPLSALRFEVVNASVGAREMRELFLLSQIMNQPREESDAALDSLLRRGLKTESLKELLADACASRGRDEQELEILRDLMASGSTNPSVYGRAAKLLMTKSVRGSGVEARLAEEVEEVRAWCNKAVELEPLYAEANEILAWAEALGPVVEKKNHEAIVAICRRLDGNAKTDMALAALATARWRMNQVKLARSLAEMINSSPLSRPAAKAAATAVLVAIEDTSSPSASETAAEQPKS